MSNYSWELHAEDIKTSYPTENDASKIKIGHVD